MAIIADAVIHAYDLTEGNRGPAASLEELEHMRMATYGMHLTWSDPAYVCPAEAYVSTWDAESLASVVFFESETDLAVYHDVSLFSVFRNGGTPIEVGAELARALPGRVLLYGGVDATAGPRAIERMDQLVEQYGVVGFKFYPVTGLYDTSTGRAEGILMDDIDRMFPLYEHARKLGVRHMAVHKAVPFRYEPMDPLFNVHDMDAAAVAFRDLTFEIVHSGFAFLEETAIQLGRHPNVYANLEISMNLIVRWPRRFARLIGTLLQFGGPHKLLHSTGCMLTHAQPIIDAFRRFEMPADLLEEGMPQVDDSIKAMILGQNLLALLGIEESELRKTIDSDEVAKARAERGLAPPWSRLPAVVS